MPQAHSYALSVEMIPSTATEKPPPHQQLQVSSCMKKSYLTVPEIRIEPPQPSHPNEVLGGSSTALIAKPTQEKSSDEKEEKEKELSVRVELEFDAFVLVCFIIAIAVPLSMVVMGGVYLMSCPAEMMIPIFLIVSGSGLIISVFGLRKLAEKQSQQMNTSCYQTLLRTAVFFQVAWFISGCVWVYRTYEPDYITSTSPNYCNPKLYQYSFWLLNSFFISLIVTVFLCFVYICFGKQNASNSPETTKV